MRNKKVWCKILSSDKKRLHSVFIEIDNDTKEITDSGCDCKFGSWYKWSKKNRLKDKKCIHVKRLIRTYKEIIGEIKQWF